MQAVGHGWGARRKCFANAEGALIAGQSGLEIVVVRREIAKAGQTDSDRPGNRCDGFTDRQCAPIVIAGFLRLPVVEREKRQAVEIARQADRVRGEPLTDRQGALVILVRGRAIAAVAREGAEAVERRSQVDGLVPRPIFSGPDRFEYALRLFRRAGHELRSGLDQRREGGAWTGTFRLRHVDRPGHQGLGLGWVLRQQDRGLAEERLHLPRTIGGLLPRVFRGSPRGQRGVATREPREISRAAALGHRQPNRVPAFLGDRQRPVGFTEGLVEASRGGRDSRSVEQPRDLGAGHRHGLGRRRFLGGEDRRQKDDAQNELDARPQAGGHGGA